MLQLAASAWSIARAQGSVSAKRRRVRSPSSGFACPIQLAVLRHLEPEQQQGAAAAAAVRGGGVLVAQQQEDYCHSARASVRTHSRRRRPTADATACTGRYRAIERKEL
jgi:hypothetical protein